MESEVSNSSMNHCSAAIITSSYNKALKPLNIYRVSSVISHYLLLPGEMLPLQLDTTLLLKKLLRVAATYGHMCTTNSMRCLSHWPFSFSSANVEQKKKRVKTGSWSGSVWCRELVYFWRSRGRARAVSFLVFYGFLCKLEFDSEPLVTVTPDAIVSPTTDLWRSASADSPALLSSCGM